MKIYLSPELTVTAFEQTDVIRTSTVDAGGSTWGNGWSQGGSKE